MSFERPLRMWQREEEKEDFERPQKVFKSSSFSIIA